MISLLLSGQTNRSLKNILRILTLGKTDAIADVTLAKLHSTNHSTLAYMEPSYQSSDLRDFTGVWEELVPSHLYYLGNLQML
jgi:hypothetical protein